MEGIIYQTSHLLAVCINVAKRQPHIGFNSHCHFDIKRFFLKTRNNKHVHLTNSLRCCSLQLQEQSLCLIFEHDYELWTWTGPVPADRAVLRCARNDWETLIGERGESGGGGSACHCCYCWHYWTLFSSCLCWSWWGLLCARHPPDPHVCLLLSYNQASQSPLSSLYPRLSVSCFGREMSQVNRGHLGDDLNLWILLSLKAFS